MTRPASERFWEKVDKHGPVPSHRPELGPCWVWLGGATPIVKNGRDGGYARFSIDSKRRVSAARFAWACIRGDFPKGLVPDHICHSGNTECPGGACIHRRCVNPDHLEPVTQRENILRMGTTGTETHCPNGHEYTAENTYKAPNGYRQCRTCKTEAMRRFNKAHPNRRKVSK